MSRPVIRQTRLRLALASLLILSPLASRAEPAKLLRFPDIHGQTVVFTYAGDIWKVPSTGGTAVRLTAHPGRELFAKISPDGKWIAFTGQYDGDEQVYLMPIGGGMPKQLTFYPARGPLPPRWGSDNQVFGWSPDSQSIIFRSLRDSYGMADGKLFTVSIKGGQPRALPMPTTGAGVFSPDGKKILYSPLFRDFRTWKRYEGGWAQDLYVFDVNSHKTTNITANPRTDRDPMWAGDNIFFASDRDNQLNIYRYDTKNSALTQLTHYTDWDVRWPSADAEGQIVYELNGTLHVLNGITGAISDIDIDVPADGLGLRPEVISVAKRIEDYALSPKGERALMTARGDVFTVPIEHGVTRNLTQSSGAHDREADWSPDGKRIAYISDRTGEEELWIENQDGRGEAEQITSGAKTRYYHPVWSPDGAHIVLGDKDGKIYVIDVKSKKAIQVADDLGDPQQDYSWSPDGRYLAFSMENANRFRSLYIWDKTGNKLQAITDETFSAYEPVWNPQGTYLYYLSDRSFAPQISDFEWNYAMNRATGIFALALRKDLPSPFPPRNDEVAGDKKDEAKPDKTPQKTESGLKPVIVDFDGLAARVTRVPVDADNYRQLHVTATHLIYTVSGASFFGREPSPGAAVKAFNIDKREAKSLADKISGYALSRDGAKILVRDLESASFKLYNVTGGAPKPVATTDLKLTRDPRQEWANAFDEVWRRYRDHFYVANMHGYDWVAIGKKYRALLKYVGDRSDLNYLMGEMIAELNASHAYVDGGDLNLPARPYIALLGARFELDETAGRYRISRIFKGQNEEPAYRSPLTEVGVNVHEGDYLMAINGRTLGATDNPYELLRGLANGPVEIAVNTRPDIASARTVVVNPLTSENKLLYMAWVQKNRDRVAAQTGGKAGYIHIPDMSEAGIYEFIKYYYGQIRKDGLVVDVRSNGGGNVSQMLIERLGRKLLGLRYARTVDHVTTYPAVTFTGPMVGILNETSSSDGDIFPWHFRQIGLGPLVGKRSWGGVIGITDHGPLIDGGIVNVPEFSNADPDGNWVIEGHGVDPDIVVENDPASVIKGEDPQLDRAIKEVLERMKTKKAALPSRPAAPNKAQK